MPKYLTYEEVKTYIENFEGYTLKSDTYIGSKYKLSIQCPNNHIFKITLGNFKKGSRCKKCSINNKYHTFNFVKNNIENIDGYKLISNDYINSTQKLDIVCPKGHLFSMSYNNFINTGQRCSICFGTNKYNYNDVKKYIESFEYKLLSKEYINTDTRIKVSCPKNHNYDVLFYKFKQGKRCRICYELNNKGINHPKWKLDRSRRDRTNSLAFNLNNYKKLKTDKNYNKFLKQKFDNNIKRNEYEIDHIFPRIAFIDNDLDKKYDINIIKEICNSRENLQILHYLDNKEKLGKYDNDKFLNWFNLKLKEMTCTV